MKPRGTNAWAVASGGVIMPWCVASTRRDAIKELVKNWRRPWEELRTQGCTVHRVRIEPVNVRT